MSEPVSAPPAVRTRAAEPPSNHRERALIYTHSTIFEPAVNNRGSTNNVYSANRQQNILAQRANLVPQPTPNTALTGTLTGTKNNNQGTTQKISQSDSNNKNNLSNNNTSKSIISGPSNAGPIFKPKLDLDKPMNVKQKQLQGSGNIYGCDMEGPNPFAVKPNAGQVRKAGLKQNVTQTQQTKSPQNNNLKQFNPTSRTKSDISSTGAPKSYWGLSDAYCKKIDGRAAWTDTRLQLVKDSDAPSPPPTQRKPATTDLQSATESWSNPVYSASASKTANEGAPGSSKQKQTVLDNQNLTAAQRKHAFLHGGGDPSAPNYSKHAAPSAEDRRQKLRVEPKENPRRRAYGETNFSDLQGEPSAPPTKIHQHSDISSSVRWHDNTTEISTRKNDIAKNGRDKYQANINKPAYQKKIEQSYSSLGRVFPPVEKNNCGSPEDGQGKSTAAIAYENQIQNSQDYRVKRRDSAFDAQQICSHGKNAFEEKIEIRRGEMKNQKVVQLSSESGAKERKIRNMMGSGVVHSFGDDNYTSDHLDRNLNNFAKQKQLPTHGYTSTIRSATNYVSVCPENPSKAKKLASNGLVSNRGPIVLNSHQRKAQEQQGQLRNCDM